MKIGELAQLTGLATSHIRFYEASGLIRGVRRKANNYRDYTPDAVVMLELIKSAQRAGFSLDQIRELLPLGSGSWKHDRLLVALKEKVAEIERLQMRLKQNRAQLITAIKAIEDRPRDIACDDNIRRVLDRLRRQGVVSSHRISPSK